MAGLEEQLNSILSSPEAMEQIMSLANSLSGKAEAAPSGDTADGGDSPPAVQPPDLSALSALLGGEGSPLAGLDPKWMETLSVLMQEYNRGTDDRAALLLALKPFLREERQAKMDRAVQLARLSRVIRASFRLFQEGGGHV